MNPYLCPLLLQRRPSISDAVRENRLGSTMGSTIYSLLIVGYVQDLGFDPRGSSAGHSL